MAKLEDVVTLTRYHHGPVGSFIDTYTVNDMPIDEFIANLQNEGIQILPDQSEKTITYSLPRHNTVDNTANIPLHIALDPKAIPQVKTLAYILRDADGLQLTLQKYGNTISRPAPGIIGGSITGEFGLAVHIRYEGRSPDTSVTEKVDRALRNTYGSESIP
jgi:hypothetical protein